MNEELIQTGFVEREDYSLYYKRIFNSTPEHKGETLVFLHDSWGCTEMWNDFPEQLGKISGLDVLVYDRRGYGKSSPSNVVKRTNSYLHDEAEVLIEVLDYFGYERMLIYGHSDGASIALIAAALYPERVSGLMLEGPHSFVEEFAKEKVREARDRSKHSGLLKSLEKYHGNNTETLFRLWHEIWLDEEFVSWTIVPLLSSIQSPVLAFQGDQDQYGTVKQLEILQQKTPAIVTTVEILGAQHTPRREAEKETMKVITGFLATHFTK